MACELRLPPAAQALLSTSPAIARGCARRFSKHGKADQMYSLIRRWLGTRHNNQQRGAKPIVSARRLRPAEQLEDRRLMAVTNVFLELYGVDGQPAKDGPALIEVDSISASTGVTGNGGISGRATLLDFRRAQTKTLQAPIWHTSWKTHSSLRSRPAAAAAFPKTASASTSRRSRSPMRRARRMCLSAPEPGH